MTFTYCRSSRRVSRKMQAFTLGKRYSDALSCSGEGARRHADSKRSPPAKERTQADSMDSPLVPPGRVTAL
jgi:hypothetical protein